MGAAANISFFPGWDGIGTPDVTYFTNLIYYARQCYAAKSDIALSGEVNGHCNEEKEYELRQLAMFIFYLEGILNDEEYWFTNNNLDTNEDIIDIVKCIIELCNIPIHLLAGVTPTALLTEVSMPFELEDGFGYILTESLASLKISQLVPGTVPAPPSMESAWALSGVNRKYTFLQLVNSIDTSQVFKDPANQLTVFVGLSSTNVEDAIEELAAAVAPITGPYTRILFFDATTNVTDDAKFIYDDVNRQLTLGATGTEESGLNAYNTSGNQGVFIGVDDPANARGIIRPYDTPDSWKLHALLTTLNVGQVQSWVNNHPNAIAMVNFVAKSIDEVVHILFGRSDLASVGGGPDSIYEHAEVRYNQGPLTNRIGLDVRYHSMVPGAASEFTNTVTVLRAYNRGGDSSDRRNAVPAGTSDAGEDILCLGWWPFATPQGESNLHFRGNVSHFVTTITAATTDLQNVYDPSLTESTQQLNIHHIVVESGNKTINLPPTTNATNETNREYVVWNAGTGKVFLVPNAGVPDTIGPAGLATANPFRIDGGAAVRVIANNTEWHVISIIQPFEEAPIQIDTMQAPASSSASAGKFDTPTSDIAVSHWAFPDTGDEDVHFKFGMPRNWDGGDIVVKLQWYPASNFGVTKWSSKAVAVVEGDSIDATWGASVAVTSTSSAAGTVYTTPNMEITPTFSGTFHDIVTMFVSVERQATDVADTLSGDARLIGCRLFYRTTAEAVGAQA